MSRSPSIAGSISVRDLSVAYAGGLAPAISGIDLEVTPGEFVALLGPSGCGKSTILNAIAGFLKPTAGEVRVNGAPVAGPSSQCAVVFQHHSLFPWMTASQNVSFGPEMLKLPTPTDHARRLLRQVGLAGWEEAFPRQLSGGMRQRVGLARALAINPPVLLMDEPFGALDAQTRLLMQELLVDLWEQRRPTVIFVTHDVDEALFLADRIVVMGTLPGVIREIVDWNQPRPRHSDFRDTIAFARAKREIGQLIREESLKVFERGLAA